MGSGRNDESILMDSLKIAIVHPSFAIKGGAENLMVWMSQGLAERGHRVTLFTTDYDPELWDRSADRCVEKVLLRPGLISRIIDTRHGQTIDYGNQLSKLLRGFDVTICSIYPSYLWVTRAKRRWQDRNGRIVWYFHEPPRKVYWDITDSHLVNQHVYCDRQDINFHLRRDREKFIRTDNPRKKRKKKTRDKKAVESIDTILANSKFSADNMRQALGGPIEVCYPGIPMPESPGGGALGQYLLSVSPLRPNKNVHNIIEALQVLSERGRRDIYLKIAGKGGCRPELENLIRSKGIASQVEFLGYLSDRELADTYRKARLGVYIPIDEPFGLIAVEFMGHGVPPIVSDHGGVSEIVIHEQTGLLVNPFDPVKIADMIASLWDDDDKIRVFSQAGRRRVEDEFTQRIFIENLEAFLVQNHER